MDNNVDISIIIPNLNSPIIDQTIDSLLHQSSPYPYEIVVVGQDKHGLIERFCTRVKFIKTDKPVNAAIARNIGITSSKGDFLLFLDSDCVPDPGWVEVLISYLEKGWDVVGGGVRIKQKEYLSLVYNLSMFHEFLWNQEERKVNYLPTLNLAVKRTVFNSIGGMNEKLDRSQDLEWTMRMAKEGIRVCFHPKASIVHKPVVKNFKSIRKQFNRSGYFSFQVRKNYQRTFSLFLLQKAWFWRWLSPLIALGITIKLVLQTPIIWRYFYVIPAIYITKVEWCIGAANRIKELDKE